MSIKHHHQQPALWAAVLFAAGICLGRLSDPPLWPMLIAALLICGLSALASRSRFHSSLPSFLLGLALLMAACLHYEDRTRLLPQKHKNHPQNQPCEVVIRGWVLSEPQNKGSDVALVLQSTAVDSGGGFVPTAGKILLRIRDFQGHLGPGDAVQVCGRLRPPGGAGNPGEFDYGQYLRRRAIFATLTARSDQVERTAGGSPGWLGCSAGWVRQYLRRVILETLEGTPGALLQGLLLGQRDDVPEEVTEAFSDSGVIHVLAVSGLHVGLIVGIFYALFSALRLPEVAVTLTTIILVAFYALVVDLRPSVVRASIMAAAVMVGRLLERDSDLINIIPFAGLLILIWNPQFLFELGFQLSFLATLSIVYLHGRLRDLCFPFLSAGSPAWLRWFCAALSVSLAAQLGTLPVIAFHFQKVPVVSLVANLVVVPLVGLSVALGFTSALLFPVSIGLARLYAAANWMVLKVAVHLVTLAAGLPGACLCVSRPEAVVIVGYYILLLLGANLRRSRAAGRAFVFGVLVLLNLLTWNQVLDGPDRLSVLFFDVGQGDAALVRFPNGRTMLVDGGERKVGRDCGQQILCPFFHRSGLRRLDVVVLTHADNDHVGGLPAVLESLPVCLVLDSGARHLSATYLRFLALAGRPGLSYHQAREGDRLIVDDRVAVCVLHPTQTFVTPDGRAPLGLNNGSVVLRLVYGRISLLLTGDIESEAERAIMDRGQAEPVTVLKVPHHGSISSSTDLFLQTLQPQLAVISVGRENTFGHPHPEVLERYQRMDMIVYRTDRDGAVLMETDGQNLWLETIASSEKMRFSAKDSEVP